MRALIDYQEKVVGVLQVINRKRNRADTVNADNAEAVVIDFDPQVQESIKALASLSAVAIQTRMLMCINSSSKILNASVAAIEQRDPTTSGHSFRVAGECALAETSQGQSGDLIRFEPPMHDFANFATHRFYMTLAR